LIIVNQITTDVYLIDMCASPGVEVVYVVVVAAAAFGEGVIDEEKEGRLTFVVFVVTVMEVIDVVVT
jgi:hypothetical protein